MDVCEVENICLFVSSPSLGLCSWGQNSGLKAGKCVKSLKLCRMDSMIIYSNRKRGSIYTSFVFSIWEVHPAAYRCCLPFRVPPCRCRLPFRVPPFLNSIPKPQSRVHFHSDIMGCCPREQRLVAAIALRAACSGIANKRHTHTPSLGPRPLWRGEGEGEDDVFCCKNWGLVSKVKLRYSAATRQGGREISNSYRRAWVAY